MLKIKQRHLNSSHCYIVNLVPSLGHCTGQFFDYVTDILSVYQSQAMSLPYEMNFEF